MKKSISQEEKKSFSDSLRANKKKAPSRKEIKKAFSREATKQAIEMCKKMITNPQARKQTIAFIKAVDGKKIRNTSGV